MPFPAVSAAREGVCLWRLTPQNEHETWKDEKTTMTKRLKIFLDCLLKQPVILLHDWISASCFLFRTHTHTSNISLLWQHDGYFSEAEADLGIGSSFGAWVTQLSNRYSNECDAMTHPHFKNSRATRMLVVKSPGLIQFLGLNHGFSSCPAYLKCFFPSVLTDSLRGIFHNLRPVGSWGCIATSALSVKFPVSSLLAGHH